MAVQNGQDANETTFNTAFLSRTQNSDTVGVVGLNNPLSASGSAVTNIQREHNSIASYVGKVLNSVFNALPTWSDTNAGLTTDNITQRSEALTKKFNPASGQGHKHNGLTGQGEKISFDDLLDVNFFFADTFSASKLAASGTSTDITTAMSGKSPGGAAAAVGVVTTAPNNKCEIFATNNGDNLEDSSGNRVYGRITESAGTWTLTFFVFNAGAESSTSIASTDITFHPVEVYNQETRPTFGSKIGVSQSLDFTADIVDATSTQRGLVSTIAQTWAGIKTFLSAPILDSLASGGVLFLSATKQVTQDIARLFWDQTNFRLGIVTGAPNKSLDVNGDFGSRWTDQAKSASITAMSTPTSAIRFTGVTPTSLHGITGGVNNKWLVLVNPTAGDVTLFHESGSASAADRINIVNGVNSTLKQYGLALLAYDDTAQRWNLLSASGSGAGSASVVRLYLPDSGGMSRVVQSNGAEIFVAGKDETSTLWAEIKISSDYTPGTQIFLKDGKVFSPATTGNFLLRTTSYIFKANVDGTSTPSGYTSTNTAQSVDATTNEIVELNDLDITNASGQINAVAVQPGDTVLVKLERLPTDGSDTLDDDLKIFADSFEPDMTA